MPIPLAPVVGAGADLLGTGINAVLTSEQNRKNREFAQKQADQQRVYALDDYHMQNAYNSPSSQMARLKDAGLNPNLVYGNGATATGGNVRSSPPAQYEGKAPQLQLGETVGRYFTTQIQELQSNNLKAQNDVLLAQKKNIDADTISKLFGGNLKEFDFNLKTELRNNSLSKAWQITKNLDLTSNLTAAQIANTKARTDTENETRQPRINAIIQSTSESAQRILNMIIQAAKSEAEISYIYTQIANAEKDGKLKQFEIELNQLGLTKNDPAWQRKASALLNHLLKL